jgi:hypothetical protein
MNCGGVATTDTPTPPTDPGASSAGDQPMAKTKRCTFKGCANDPVTGSCRCVAHPWSKKTGHKPKAPGPDTSPRAAARRAASLNGSALSATLADLEAQVASKAGEITAKQDELKRLEHARNVIAELVAEQEALT